MVAPPLYRKLCLAIKRLIFLLLLRNNSMLCELHFRVLYMIEIMQIRQNAYKKKKFYYAILKNKIDKQVLLNSN